MAKHESGLTCIHAAEGLCPACVEEYDEDPSAYLEYGAHPAGERRWAEEQKWMAADAAQDPTPSDAWEGIPF